MKFPLKLHKELISLINSKGFRADEFTFVKKGGRIVTVCVLVQRRFSFFKKKETDIDAETGQFIDSSFYLYRYTDRQENRVDSWEEIRGLYLDWLETLKEQSDPRTRVET